MGDSMPTTPMDHFAKFDAVSEGGEIRNRTNTKTNKQTSKQKQ